MRRQPVAAGLHAEPLGQWGLLVIAQLASLVGLSRHQEKAVASIAQAIARETAD